MVAERRTPALVARSIVSNDSDARYRNRVQHAPPFAAATGEMAAIGCRRVVCTYLWAHARRIGKPPWGSTRGSHRKSLETIVGWRDRNDPRAGQHQRPSHPERGIMRMPRSCTRSWEPAKPEGRFEKSGRDGL